MYRAGSACADNAAESEDESENEDEEVVVEDVEVRDCRKGGGGCVVSGRRESDGEREGVSVETERLDLKAVARE